MSKSTFRILLLVLCGIFVLLYEIGQNKPAAQSDDEPVTTKDIDSEEVTPSKAELPQYNPIGFAYQKKENTEPLGQVLSNPKNPSIHKS